MSLKHTTITGRVAAPRLFRPSCHAPVRGAITDHRDDVRLPLQAQCLPMPNRPGEADRGHGVLESCGDSWRLGYPDRPSAWRSTAAGEQLVRMGLCPVSNTDACGEVGTRCNAMVSSTMPSRAR